MPVRYVLVFLVLAGCATTGGASRTWEARLSASERSELVRTTPRPGRVVRSFWRTTAPWGLLKWDAETSFSASACPPDLLQQIRDEVGRLNQVARRGPDARLTVTVYGYRAPGVFHQARIDYTAVARSWTGALLWLIDDSIAATPEMRPSLAESDSSLFARELGRRVRLELNQ